MNCGRQWRAFNNEGRLMRVHEESMEKEFTAIEDNKHITPLAMWSKGIGAHAVLPTNRKRAEPCTAPVTDTN